MYKLKTGWRVVITLTVEVVMAFVGFGLPAWIANHTVQDDFASFGAIFFCAGWVVLTIILAIWTVTPPETNT